MLCSACFAFLCYSVNLLHNLMTSAGRFGVGVKAYFVFLRYLLCLNFLNFIVISVFVLSPTFYKERRSMNCKHVEVQRILGSVCWFCSSANIILVFFKSVHKIFSGCFSGLGKLLHALCSMLLLLIVSLISNIIYIISLCHSKSD